MKLSIGLKVANSLSLTPQLQQAIRLLQLSSLELEQEIQIQLDSNPLLEKLEEENHSMESLDTIKEEQQEKELSESLNADHLPDELPVDTDWDDVYTHQSSAMERPEFEEREDNRQGDVSLKSHMLEQINLLHFSPVDRLIAYCLVDALDEKGYLDAEIEEIIASVQHLLEQMDYDVEEDEVIAVLKLIQRLDPIGIGSRNLAECLMVQVESLSELEPFRNEAILLLKHYGLLLTNDLNKLIKQTGLNAEILRSAIDLLKTLKPYPGMEFENKDSDYQIPDVVVMKKDGHWHVQLNPDVMPKLRINPYYSGMIRRADQSDDNQYLRNQMLEAKNFIKSVDERHKTLLKVATCIVKHQRDFLEIGAEGMKPLILRDVADEVELHESTISRVTTNKFLLTPRGLFELKYFF